MLKNIRCVPFSTYVGKWDKRKPPVHRRLARYYTRCGLEVADWDQETDDPVTCKSCLRAMEARNHIKVSRN